MEDVQYEEFEDLGQAELEELVKEELEELVKEVLEKRDRIIPIIGDDCYVGFSEKDSGKVLMPLQQWLTEELLAYHSSDSIKKKISSCGFHGLDLLYEEYGRVFPKKKGFLHFKNRITSIIEKGISEKRVFIREDVKDFLLAGKFKVVVTTCPYDILQNEITYGDKIYNISSFVPQKNLGTKSRSEAKLELPSIYQLFGNCKDEYVSGEGSLLKFLHYINQTDTEKGFGASQLVKYIKDKGQDNRGLGLLMPIGCNNLPNWIFRFLWYPFCVDRLLGNDSDNQGGVWHKYSNDESFYAFLDKYNFRTFSEPTDVLKSNEMDGDPVLIRLTKEFQNRDNRLNNYISSELQIQNTNNDEWDFFISYASEDLDFVQKVYDVLNRRFEKTVWMDRRGRIKPGDEYWDAIQHGIEHSKRFVFIVTESYLRKAIGKNFVDETGYMGPTGVYQEIELIKHHILNKKKDGDKVSSIPLILDGTKVTYTDNAGVMHVDEPLYGGLLEKLPRFKEYEMLQTDSLFLHIQDCICNENNIEDNLINLFHRN